MNEATKNGPIGGPQADRGDIDRQEVTSSRFKPLDSFRVNPYPRKGGHEGQTAETFSLSYLLEGEDHSVTYEANAANDVDVLTDGEQRASLQHVGALTTENAGPVSGGPRWPTALVC